MITVYWKNTTLKRARYNLNTTGDKDAPIRYHQVLMNPLPGLAMAAKVCIACDYSIERFHQGNESCPDALQLVILAELLTLART